MKARVLVLGIFEVVGGLLGAWVFVAQQWGIGSADAFSLGLAGIVAALVYLGSTAAGALLLMQRRAGLVLSALVQAMQVPHFRALGLAYSVSAGASITCELRWPRLESWAGAGLGSDLAIGLLPPGTPMMLGINALPLLIGIAVLVPVGMATYGYPPSSDEAA